MDTNDKHIVRVERNAKRIQKLYYKFADQISKEALKFGLEVPENEIFSFDKHPRLRTIANKLFKGFANDLLKLIAEGNTVEWTMSEADNKKILDSLAKRFDFPKDLMTTYNAQNLAALASFQSRKIAGLNLSERVWKYTQQYREQIEIALDYGIGQGHSAARIARNVKHYLQEPDMLFRRVRDHRGELQLSKKAQAYKPGQGVYRSSYKNAMRLARTENNMAYHKADQEKYKQFDFVIGVEIRLSNTHHLNGCEMCDELKGEYPVDFTFIGWHPQCKCHTIPILRPLGDIEENLKRIAAGKPRLKERRLKEPPKQFVKWIKDNREKIDLSNLPWILQENKKLVETILSESQ